MTIHCFMRKSGRRGLHNERIDGGRSKSAMGLRDGIGRKEGESWRDCERRIEERGLRWEEGSGEREEGGWDWYVVRRRTEEG